MRIHEVFAEQMSACSRDQDNTWRLRHAASRVEKGTVPLERPVRCREVLVTWVLIFRFVSKVTYTAAKESIVELVELVLVGIGGSAWPSHFLCVGAVTVEAGSLPPWSRCRALGGMSSMVHHFFSVGGCLHAALVASGQEALTVPF